MQIFGQSQSYSNVFHSVNIHQFDTMHNRHYNSVIMNETKTCSICKTAYPKTTDYFYKARGTTLASICKECARQKTKENYFDNHEASLSARKKYREANREKLREYHKNPSEKRKTYKKVTGRARRLLKTEELKVSAHKRYLKNKSAYYARAKRWEKRNPEKVADYNRAKRMKRRGAYSDKDARVYMQILINDPCAFCGSKKELVIDHIHPISKGGKGDFMNLTAACRSCNAAKSNKSLLNFLIERRTFTNV